jgi:AraC family transcriptional regulator
MNPSNRALWFIESHFASELTLDDIAAAGCVSRHHMTRAFGTATGYPVMRYVRGRRLSEAARALAAGAPDILALALAAGYGSHEAFTRAFREQFGLTPEAVRAQGHADNLALLEPIKMNETLLEHLEPLRYENGRALLIAGLGGRYNCENGAAIPAQWQRFGPHIGHIPGQIGQVAYGVCCNGDDQGNLDYICGVEVADIAGLPADWTHVRIPPQRYVVFLHRDHVSTIRRTWNTIWNRWLPASGLEAARSPDLERYGETFDPLSGMGGVEIWIPLKS